MMHYYVGRVYGVRPSVCPVGVLTVTHQGAAFDTASVHFGPTVKRSDVVLLTVTDVMTIGI